jgi:dGTP triphosphohydrolase
VNAKNTHTLNMRMMKMSKDIEYINEDIEDAYDAYQYVQRIDNRNRMLVKWTKFGAIIIKGDNKCKKLSR